MKTVIYITLWLLALIAIILVITDNIFVIIGFMLLAIELFNKYRKNTKQNEQKK